MGFSNDFFPEHSGYLVFVVNFFKFFLHNRRGNLGMGDFIHFSIEGKY